MKRLIKILLLITSVSNLFAQGDKQCFEKLYKVSDTLPELISSPELILSIIKSQIVIPDSLKSREGGFGIRYVINCRGNVVGLKKTKTQNSSGEIIQSPFDYICPMIIDILTKNLKWKPARSSGQEVDFLQYFSIYFFNGNVTISLTAT